MTNLAQVINRYLAKLIAPRHYNNRLYQNVKPFIKDSVNLLRIRAQLNRHGFVLNVQIQLTWCTSAVGGHSTPLSKVNLLMQFFAEKALHLCSFPTLIVAPPEKNHCSVLHSLAFKNDALMTEVLIVAVVLGPPRALWNL